MRRSGFVSLLRLLSACGLVGGLALIPSTPSFAETPPPLPEPSYVYEQFPSVAIEVQGTYTEHYTDGLGDTEIADFNFQLKREFTSVTLGSGTSPPNPDDLGIGFDAGPDHLEGTGTYEFVLHQENLEEPSTCDYLQKSTEPPPANGAPGIGLTELDYVPEQIGAMSVRFGYPLSGSLISVTAGNPEDAELCSEHSGVGTSGDPSSDIEYLLALSPSNIFYVDLTSAQAEQTFKFPHSFSSNINGDQVDLKDEVVVKVDRIPHLGPPKSEGGPPPEQHGPSTPISQPTKSEEPHVPEPEVEGNPPEITGGGGTPTKLRTGINAKCPKAEKPCTVTGIAEAELPAPRPSGKASAASKAKVRRVTLGRTVFSLAAGAHRSVSITLTRAGVAFLRAHPGVRVKILVGVSAPGFSKASRTRTAKLRLPNRRR